MHKKAIDFQEALCSNNFRVAFSSSFQQATKHSFSSQKSYSVFIILTIQNKNCFQKKSNWTPNYYYCLGLTILIELDIPWHIYLNAFKW